jgi:hypothetical protein
MRYAHFSMRYAHFSMRYAHFSMRYAQLLTGSKRPRLMVARCASKKTQKTDPRV